MLIDDFKRPAQAPRPSKPHIKPVKTFKTPEEIAATDTVERPATMPLVISGEAQSDRSAEYMKKRLKQKPGGRFRLHWPPGKKEWAVAIVVLLLIGIGSIFVFGHHTNKLVAVYQHLVEKPVAPTTVASKLTGLQVSKAQAALPVTAVMIENSDAARPQSGLSDAGVIYEAIAEGGITRFMALFQDTSPDSIGPVRSARPYYIDQLLPFDAAYAHVGGSPDALNSIPSLGVKDMNQFYNSNYYTRVTSRDAPHNVYTSTATLLTLEQAKGWKTSNFTGFPRKADKPSKVPTAAAIDLNISYPDMAAHYIYDPKLNSYLRDEAGVPLLDANSNKQLEPKVVIAIVIPISRGALDASGAYYTDYSDIGSGTAYVFQDGALTQGVWKKSSPASQIQFTNADGSALKLNAGQTWITAVGSAANVTYSH